MGGKEWKNYVQNYLEYLTFSIYTEENMVIK